MTDQPRIDSTQPRLRRPSRRTIVLILSVAGLGLIGSGIQFARTVSALRAQRATGPNWSFPSRVFSNGVPLIVGRTASDEYLLSQLKARDYIEVPGSPEVPGTYARGTGGYSIVLRGFPDEVDPEGGGGPERVVVRAQDGRILGVDRLGGIAAALPPDLAHPPRLEPVLVSMLFDKERMWRTYVSLERVPLPVREAIVTSEDRRFYSHIGVDFLGSARALSVNLRKGGIRQGGSTITQQLARGLFLGRERTLIRKLGEVPLALGLEVLLSKDQILEMYLNSVYWGQAEGFSVGGIAEAARWYFDAPIESLGVLEGATLAAMIPAPNLFNPFKDPDRVRERRNSVLEALEQTKKLKAGEAVRLAAAPLALRRGKAPIERFPSYSSYVNEALDGVLRHHATTHFGLSIYTTMDLAWQEAAEYEIDAGLAQLDRASGRRRKLEGAFVVIEPARASVLAMVGGRMATSGTYNRAFQAQRQTGSAIKPIVYAAAFAGGLTPATTVPDVQVTYGRGRHAWRPRNFDGVYHQQVTLAKALENSLNLATTAVVERVGPRQIAKLAADFGLKGLKPVMSIGLGSNEASLLQITSAFTVFASQGMLRRPSPLRLAVDRTGRKVAGPSIEASQVIPPGIAALMTGLLQNVTRYGVARALIGTYGFNRPVAGKTGTSNDFHDAWFVGFTPELVAGVWVGYDRPASIGQQASRTALPLWARAVGRMLRGFPAAPFLSDTELEWANMDPWTGCLADSLSGAERTPFVLGTAPTTSCVPDSVYQYEIYSPDSAYYEEDSTWADEPDTTLQDDPPEFETPEVDT
ncbi:MAG: transglycosylase domain-containing protein, partial [Candidatus Eisenbacteria bacterium]